MANAGSGKTKVLVDRLLRLLLEGVEPRSILCLTYTKAAAAEMQNRLYHEAKQWLLLDEAELSKTLDSLFGYTPDKETVAKARQLFFALLDEPEALNIQTIHSFCQEILNIFPFEAQVPLSYRVIDSNDTHAYLEQAWRELLLREHDDKVILQVLKTLAKHFKDGSLKEALRQVIAEPVKLKQLVEHHSSLNALTSIYDALGCAKTDSEHGYYEAVCRDQHWLETLRRYQSALEAGTAKNKATAKDIATWLAFSEDERVKQFDRILGIFFTKSGSPAALSRMTTKGMCEQYPEVEAWANQLREKLIAMRDQANALRCAEVTEALAIAGYAWLQGYEAIKRQHYALDYDDLIQATVELFAHAEFQQWVLYRLDARIDHVLIDEAQDTSPEQWSIVARIIEDFFTGAGKETKQPRSLFVVGDEKQSIYSFQGADLKYFHEVKQQISDHASASAANLTPVELHTSYRSASEILEFVDSLCAIPTIHQAISHEAKITHVAHKDFAGQVVVWPALKANEKQERNPWQLPDRYILHDNTQARLADQIADTIAGWLKEQRYLEDKGRIMRPDDIMVLVRKRDSFVHELMRALYKKNVPVTGLDRLKLGEHLAVEDLVALGNFLLLPEDDYTLACVLKSPIGRLSEQELFSLAYGREGSVWQSLSSKHTESERFQEVHALLSELLARVDHTSPSELYIELLEAKNYRKHFHARFGEEVQDILSEFIQLVTQYTQTHNGSLQDFLAWFTSSDVEIARQLDQRVGQVKVMTVHGAKGLQAPIVFVVDGAMPTLNKRSILWHGTMPFVKAAKEDRPDIVSTLLEQETTSMLEEYYRLL